VRLVRKAVVSINYFRAKAKDAGDIPIFENFLFALLCDRGSKNAVKETDPSLVDDSGGIFRVRKQ
jgi:hypothetical protein